MGRLPSNAQRPYMKRTCGHRVKSMGDRQRGCVTVEADPGGLQLHAQEHQALGRETGQDSPSEPAGGTTLPTPGFLTSGLWSSESIDSCGLATTYVGFSFPSPVTFSVSSTVIQMSCIVTRVF